MFLALKIDLLTILGCCGLCEMTNFATFSMFFFFTHFPHRKSLLCVDIHFLHDFRSLKFNPKVGHF